MSDSGGGIPCMHIITRILRVQPDEGGWWKVFEWWGGGRKQGGGGGGCPASFVTERYVEGSLGNRRWMTIGAATPAAAATQPCRGAALLRVTTTAHACASGLRSRTSILVTCTLKSMQTNPCRTMSMTHILHDEKWREKRAEIGFALRGSARGRWRTVRS
jgi:hypothetical protein